MKGVLDCTLICAKCMVAKLLVNVLSENNLNNYAHNTMLTWVLYVL